MSSISHSIGSVFQPLLKAVADFLAILYSFIPIYPVDVALLTIAIMAILTPLTVKSTKNMAAMQALGPEMKKLQQKYKGAENRAVLNEEMMKLYKEHKVNPASGCLPMLLQMPAFLILYDVIRGITNTVTIPAKSSIVGGLKTFVPAHVVAEPRYIGHTTKMYHDIVAAHGQLNSFGMDWAAQAVLPPQFDYRRGSVFAVGGGLGRLAIPANESAECPKPRRQSSQPTGGHVAKIHAAYLWTDLPKYCRPSSTSISSFPARSGSGHKRCCSAGGSWAVPRRGPPPARKPSRPRGRRAEVRRVPSPTGPSERSPGPGRPSSAKPSAGTTRRSGSGGTGRPAPKPTPANARTNGANGRAKSAAGGNGSAPTAGKPNPSRGTGSNGSGSTRNPKPGSAPRGTRNSPDRAAATPPEEGSAPKEHPRSKAKRERKAR